MFSLFAQKDNGFARFFISHPVFLNSRKAVAHLVGIIRAFGAQVNIGGANIGVVVYGLVHFQIFKFTVKHNVAGVLMCLS